VYLKYDFLGKYIFKYKIKPNRVFIIAVFVTGVIEHLIIPKIAHYHITKGFLWYLELSNAFIVTPIWWWFYVWSMYSIAELKDKLIENKVVKLAAKKQLIAWHQNLEEMLGKWYIFISVLVLSLYAAITNIYGWIFEVPPWFGRNNIIHFVFSSILTISQWYIMAWALVREIIFAISIRRLFVKQYSDFVVRYAHPDGAGGFGVVGAHATSFVLLVLFVGYFHLSKTFETYYFASLSTATGFGALFGWFIYLISVPLIFGFIVLPCHTAMKHYKDELLVSITELIQNKLSKLNAAPSKNDLPAKRDIESIESLQTISNNIMKDVAVWPLRNAIPRFTIAGLWPLITGIIPIFLERIMNGK
jgi:hypothetical protein